MFKNSLAEKLPLVEMLSSVAPEAVRIAMFVIMSGAFSDFLLLAFTRYRTGVTSGYEAGDIQPRERNE